MTDKKEAIKLSILVFGVSVSQVESLKSKVTQRVNSGPNNVKAGIEICCAFVFATDDEELNGTLLVHPEIDFVIVDSGKDIATVRSRFSEFVSGKCLSDQPLSFPELDGVQCFLVRYI